MRCFTRVGLRATTVEYLLCWDLYTGTARGCGVVIRYADNNSAREEQVPIGVRDHTIEIVYSFV